MPETENKIFYMYRDQRHTYTKDSLNKWNTFNREIERVPATTVDGDMLKKATLLYFFKNRVTLVS